MPADSPSTHRIHSLVYGNGDENVDVEVDDPPATGHNKNRKSMYVELFEANLKTVIEFESDLFSTPEIKCFMRYWKLSYNAKYLLVRLCLRKTDRWHRLSQLKYVHEIGDDGLTAALKELCGIATSDNRPEPPSKAKPKAKGKKQEAEVIDLTLDSDEEEEEKPDPQPVAGPSTPPPSLPSEPNYDVFAYDDSDAELHELLDCLMTDELRDLAKRLKTKHNGKRDELITGLLNTTLTQTILSFVTQTSNKQKDKKGEVKKEEGLRQTQLPFQSLTAPKVLRERLRHIVMDTLKQCIRLNDDVVKLFRRVNLVYYRSTQYTATMLTPSILSRAKKRNFAEIANSRTPDIWPSREALLQYEEALELEARVDGLLSGTVDVGVGAGRGRSVASRTPAPGKKDEGKMGGGESAESPSKKRVGKENADKGRGVRVKVEDGDEDVLEIKEKGKGKEKDKGKEKEKEKRFELPPERAAIVAARTVKEIFEEVYPRWKALVATKEEESEGVSRRPKALQRFECGHVLTRIVCKGASALGTLKEYTTELEVLESLLAQRRWRRGRRGRWHERRALLLMTHIGKGDGEESVESIWKRAYEAVVEGLEDEDTHIIYRPSLERRLTRIEKKLNIPLEERHVCEGHLAEPKEVYVEGDRVEIRNGGMILDKDLRIKAKPPDSNANEGGGEDVDERRVAGGGILIDPDSPKPMGKSIWFGRNGEEITVEEVALQHYEDLGFRGFHCEGRIITTLFGLIFWDIIFAKVPGAFETPYQTAPLDIAEDTFYNSRKEKIDKRLEDILNGEATRFLKRFDDEHRQKERCCVGVKWDKFTKAELIEIAECIGGEGLSAICRVLCEDYAGRTAGVPDLIVWNAEKKECKFVEVKGPNDKLQPNQKIWIDVLSRAGVPVELCHVVEQGRTRPTKAKTKPKTKRKPTKRKRNSNAEDEDGLEGDVDDPIVLKDEDEYKPRISFDDDDPMVGGGLGERARRSSSRVPIPTKRVKVEDEDEIQIIPRPKKQKTL
ncbi:hypothetical protein K474DRAFT_1644316 [Panus rudis PR-1116 ss-1]|nr:hypothetical protein K474DRAFT_1644316 [Panus rudis PR-1116 ss-1]